MLALLAMGGLIVSLSLPKQAMADSLTGRVALTYSHSETRETDLTSPIPVPANDTEARAVIQQYMLTLDKNLYPNLKLFASGTFQKSDFTSDLNGEGSWSSSTLVRPYIDLALRTPLYLIDANYNSATTETKTNTGVDSTLYHKAYTGIFGWNPVDLPTTYLQVSKAYDYDQEYAFTNTVTNQTTLTSTWLPWPSLQLRYQGNYQVLENHIEDLETRIFGQDGRANYNDTFFHDVLSLSGYYDYGYRTTETITSGQGNVSVQLFAADGLLVSSNIPVTVKLNSAPFLIDNTTTGPQNAANNIGTDTFPLDTTTRNIGLQFTTATQLNTLDVWVFSLSGPTLATAIPTYLQTAVANSFIWSVYTSSDNQNWTLFQTGISAPYEIDVTNTGVGKFIISFPAVTTTFIKVVVNPLLPPAAGGPTTNFPGVYVTELQAFMTVPASTVPPKIRATNQLFDVNTQVRIFQTPSTSLYYNMIYTSNEEYSAFATTRLSTLQNSLTLSHRFSAVFSGSARAARTDQTDPAGTSVQDEFNIQFLATPLRTLNHSLNYYASTRVSEIGLRSSTEALFMTNTAELYKDVTAFLNGGLSTATSETDLKTDSENYTWGLNVVPIKTLTITLSNFREKDTQSGTVGTEQTTRTTSSIASVAYYPFSLLYLTGSWQKFVTNDRSNTIKSYGVNWSPLPGGSLQLAVSYVETLQTQDNSIDKSLTPSMRWTINRGSYITAAYTSTTSTSDIRDATSRLYAVTLNIAL